MQPEKLKTVDCANCVREGRTGHNAAFQTTRTVLTLGGRAKSVLVTRCAFCDTSPCAICRTRTLKVNQKRCLKCGHDLLPRASK